MKGNSTGWLGLEEYDVQQKTNPKPSSKDSYTACCSARVDAKEGISHKPNRYTIQSLASGFFSCQSCLMSSHNDWLLCRKQQRKSLKMSMYNIASNGSRQCQVNIAVSCMCQCALEPFLHFQKSQNSYIKQGKLKRWELFPPYSLLYMFNIFRLS